MDTVLDIAKIVLPLILSLPAAVKATLELLDRRRAARKDDEER
ncbi:hypothetical protein GCM10009551_054210 [Nocardiopsis tropica]